MYAVLTTGGKQYRVEAGNELLIERVAGDPGSSITFDRVLLVGDGDAVTVGTPTVDGATVSATVLGEALGPKLAVFKFKQKVKYRRMAGHRQHLLRVRIDEISAAGRRSKAETAEKAADDKPKRAARSSAAKAETAEKAAGDKTKRSARASSAKPKASAEAADEKPKRARTTAATKKPAAKKKPAKSEE